MELYKTLTNELSILKISGNSRFRILNDFEDGLIDKKYIKIKKDINPNIYLTVNHMDSSNRLEELSAKKYIKFNYQKKIPMISMVWEFDEFTPSTVIYPITNIKDETYNMFNLCKTEHGLCFDISETLKNEKIMDAEYHLCKPTIPKRQPRNVFPSVSSLYN